MENIRKSIEEDNFLEFKESFLKNAEIKGKVIKDVDPHAMFITGIDEEGNLIVSTWGGKAKLLNGKIGDSFILSLDFDIDNSN